MSISFNANDVLEKHKCYASLHHSTLNNNKNNDFSVDWNLKANLAKYEKHRIFLSLDNILTIQNVNASNALNNKMLILTGEGIEFRHRNAGSDEPQILTHLRSEIVSGIDDRDYNVLPLSSNQLVYELEKIPNDTIRFKIFNKRKSPNDSNVVNNVRLLATNNDDTSIFEFFEIQFSLIILKSLK